MPDKPDKNDIWSKRPKRQGPPDLDELINKLQQKINSFFGRKKKTPAGGDATTKTSNFKWIWFLLFIVVLIWFLSGIFIVSPAKRAAVLRFGKYASTVGPGPHWIPRIIESRRIVNVQNISTFPYKAEMLTKDENIVSVAIAVQYRIANVRDYLFNVVDPNVSLQQATASALRQVIGQTTLDEILTTGREDAREQITQQLNDILNRYHTGLVITDVTLQPAQPPEAVTEAFDDVNKAREDEQRYVNYAKAYQQKVVPIAQGRAARIAREAEAYQQQVILDAKAKTVRFLALLPQYERAPVVTRERLYLDAITAVLSKSTPIVVDTKGGNVMYLPLDKILAKHMSSVKLSATDTTTTKPESTDASVTPGDSYRPSYDSAGGEH